MDHSTLRAASGESRAKLAEALGALQDVVVSGLDITKVVKQVAHAQAALFDLEKEAAGPAGNLDFVARAMEHLAAALQLLQDVRVRGPKIEAAASLVAEVLARLFPLRKALEGQSARETGARDPGAAPLPTREDDLRKTVRVDLGTAIGGESSTTFYTGFSENISSGGIFISTFNLQPINSKVLVSFVLPTGHQVTARGRVRWVREYDPANPDQPPGMGVRFADLMASDKEAIDKYLRAHPPLFYDDD